MDIREKGFKVKFQRLDKQELKHIQDSLEVSNFNKYSENN